MTTDVDEREVLTWARFGVAARELAVQIADSGYRPDLIFSIARGGLFVAGAANLSFANTIRFASPSAIEPTR